MRTATILLAATAVLLSACATDEEPPPEGGAPERIDVTSSAFSQNEDIPTRYTCDGDGVSPPLAWSGVPDGSVEIVLVVDDPDAPSGSFVHWLVWGIDPGTTRIDEGPLPDGVVQGETGAGEASYVPPCPPEGDDAHRYRFTVYAVSEPVALSEGAPAEDLYDALEGTSLGQGRLTAVYAR